MKPSMPTVYRTLIAVSGVTFVVSGWALQSPFIVWGWAGQTIIVVAGTLMLATAWIPRFRDIKLTAYMAGFAGGLLISTAWFLPYWPARLSAIVVWSALSAYTVGLLAYGWMRDPPS